MSIRAQFQLSYPGFSLDVDACFGEGHADKLADLGGHAGGNDPVFWLVCLVSAGVMLWLFRRRRWI